MGTSHRAPWTTDLSTDNRRPLARSTDSQHPSLSMHSSSQASDTCPSPPLRLHLELPLALWFAPLFPLSSRSALSASPVSRAALSSLSPLRLTCLSRPVLS